MLILGIETSCDETSCAVVEDGVKIRSQEVSSQVKAHSPYGGVVPELACREHIKNMIPVLERVIHEAGISLHDIDAVAVTQGPGLIGSLLVGLETAKALCFTLSKPLVGVHHLAAHLYSAVFAEKNAPHILDNLYPFLGMVVSGGHTSMFTVESPLKYQQIGQTLDDAAGEAFDKVARLLGIGYPGGPIIDRLAAMGNSARIRFPRPNISSGDFNFSFSGLKTAVAGYVRHKGFLNIKANDQWLRDICASFQEAVIDSLLIKLEYATKIYAPKNIVIAGGVASNRRLGDEAMKRFSSFRVIIPPPPLCTDNAVMVAGLGYHYLLAGKTLDLTANACGRLPL